MRNKIFEDYPIPKAILTLAIPTVLGTMVTVIYNIADTYFIGKTGNPHMVSAVSLCMPVFYILMALGNLFGVGGGTLISRLLGAKEGEQAKQASSYAFYNCLFTGILMLTIILVFQDFILSISGTSVNTYDYTREYLFYLAFGAPAIMLQCSFGHIVRAEGASRIAMCGMMIGTVINIILDPIFISVLNWGPAGAAIATVIGNYASVIFYLIYLNSKKTVLSISIKKLRYTKFFITSVGKIGVPSTLLTLLTCVAVLIMNVLASKHGDTELTALTLSYRIVSFPSLVLIAWGQGMQPFVGYNYGAKNKKRLVGAIKFSILSGVAFGVLLTVVMCVRAEPIIRAFLDSDEIVKLGGYYLKIFCVSLPFIAVPFVFINTFQACAQAIPSLLSSVVRLGIGFIPSLFLFDILWGPVGMAWSMGFADLLCLIFTTAWFLFFSKKLGKEIDKQHPAPTT